MGLIISIIGCFIAAAAAVAYISIAMHDIKTIQQERRANKPRFRNLPFVSVIVDDNVSDVSLESIALSDYRKHDVFFAGEPIYSDITLSLGYNVILERSAISQAVRELSATNGRAFVEIKPIIQTPTLPHHVFRLHHFAASSLFISIRSLFHIQPFAHSRWPVARKRSAHYSAWQSHVYRVICWLVSLINALILAFFTYIAVILNQPELLFIYIAVFLVWLTVGIWDYPHFSFKQKIVYTLLAPVSLGYFWIVALYTPFAPLTRKIGKAITIVLWRSYNQPVV